MSTRLFPASATYRFPFASTPIPRGPQRLSAPRPATSIAATPLLHLYENRSGCPSAISAGLALVKDETSSHPSTRLFAVSAAYKWRWGGADDVSIAIPAGRLVPIEST